MAALTRCPTLKTVQATASLRNRRARSQVSAATPLSGSCITTCSLPNKPRDTRTQGARKQHVNAVAASDVWLSEKVEWKEDKRIQTQVTQVAEDTTTIRSLDWDRDRFDIEFGLQVCTKSCDVSCRPKCEARFSTVSAPWPPFCSACTNLGLVFCGNTDAQRFVCTTVGGNHLQLVHNSWREGCPN